MNTGKEHSSLSKKLRGGPGGFRCPCCNPFREHPRKSKKLSSRYARRVAKMTLIKREVE